MCKQWVCVLSALLLSGQSWAGVYSDDLSKCLVASTSDKDRTMLVRWVFANATLHPDVADLSKVPDDMRDQLNRATAAIFERLISDSCRKQTREAFKYEGALAFQQSFGVLGQVAMMGLTTDSRVSAGFGAFANYLDKNKIDALMKED